MMAKGKLPEVGQSRAVSEKPSQKLRRKTWLGAVFGTAESNANTAYINAEADRAAAGARLMTAVRAGELAQHELETVEEDFKLLNAKRNHDLAQYETETSRVKAEGAQLNSEYEAKTAFNNSETERYKTDQLRFRNERKELQASARRAPVDEAAERKKQRAAVEKDLDKTMRAQFEVDEEVNYFNEKLKADGDDPAILSKVRKAKAEQKLLRAKVDRLNRELDHLSGLA